jgi:hypothetical protein
MTNPVLHGGIGRVLLVILLGIGGVTQAQTTLTWTAFNDHYAGGNTGAYSTAWNVYGTLGGAPGNSGALRNSVTGEGLPGVLTITSSGNLGQGTSSGAPNPGTPAELLFRGHIDWGSGINPHAPLVNPGTEVRYAFSGLDPNKRYSFVGTGIRGGMGGDYGLRWTLVELVGAGGLAAAHTAGAAVYTNGMPSTQVAINTGQNSATGDYAAWDNIKPAADGSFAIRCTHYGGPIANGNAGGPYAYGLMAIRLQEFNTAPTPAAILTQPTNQTVVEGAPANFQVTVAGNPPPTLQWYKNGALIPDATNPVLSWASVPLADDQAGFFVVASNWVANTSCLATSGVARLTVQPDRTPPLVRLVLPATNSLVTTLRSIEVFFNKPVAGVGAADLLINGEAAAQVEWLTPAQYLFNFDQPLPGTVQVAWSPSHQIRDLTAAANPFAGGGWEYRLDTNILFSVRLNEFLAANRRVNRDEDGDYSDWIELFNSGSSSVALEGCYLTDDARSLRKWAFPPITIPPLSYLLVWASGKDRTNSTAPLHANFQLDKEGGYLALVAPDGVTILSSFTPDYPPQYTDVSFGCDRSDASLIGYFSSPTPRAANTAAGSGFAPQVHFSRPSGTFTAPFSLTLSTTTTNAVIRYTLGTNAPTAASTLYTGPIPVNNTIRVRARAFVAGLMPGEIHSENYLYLDPSASGVIGFSSPLPIVVFHNHGKGDVPYSDPGQLAMIQVFEPKNGRSSLTNAPDLAVTSTIHRRGQATRWLPKMNLRVETIDEYGDNNNVSMVGFPADDDWVFYAINGYDKVLMHNPLAHELYRQLGRYSSRTRFVEVFLKDDAGTPGPITAADYNGLYVIHEKLKIAKDRVDIDELQPENTNAPSITGGYLFSVDKDGPAPGFYAADSSMWYLDPDGPTISTPQRVPQLLYLNNYLNAFYSALTGPAWTNPTTGYAAYIDVPAFIDYHLHQVLVFNVDMLRISAYYCKPRNGKLTPAALWDFDRAFAMYSADGDYRGFNPWRWRSAGMDGGTDPFNPGNTFHNPWYSRLFNDPDFWQRWIDRYQELRKSTYSSSNVTALISQYAAEIDEATTREYARWRGAGSSDTTPNQGTVSADGWTYRFPTPGTWAGQVEFIKVWFTNRMTFMDTNFLAPPTFSHPGGQVPFGTTLILTPAQKAGSSVFYTLDGSDPRLPGGAISPAALSSGGPVVLTITSNVLLTARSRNPNHRNLTGPNNPPLTSPWSGPSTQSYYVAMPSLRITEIMYHPGLLAAGDTNDPGNYEYLELANVGSNPLNLAGFKLTQGIAFTFGSSGPVTSLAPGERVLVVRNLAAFASRYPGAISRVAGEFVGQLDNAGEGIGLVGPSGEPIHHFTFDNRWHPITDGLGFSLVVVDSQAPLTSWDLSSQWRPSAYDGGSPGALDPTPIVHTPVIVNEVLSHPVPPEDDAIELWNPREIPLDVGYWYLTDDPGVPRKYLIPPGTVIPGNGFVVFRWGNSFGVAGGANALGKTNEAFGLSAEGERVAVFSGNSQGSLTGYFDEMNFGPAAAGVAFGRYTNSLGQILNVAQSVNTLGSANAYPKVGPLVLTEIMYHPPDLSMGGLPVGNARDECLELYNLADETIPLYDTDHPANTWRIDGGIQYEFPTGITLAPHGYLLLVNFSPAADPIALEAFHSRYGLSNNVPLYGPYEGRLNNAGDRLDLHQPGVPDPNTRVAPLILVDRVDYSPVSPWPTAADGAGASLQRRDFGAFGNDPANWFAAWPSPGRGQAPALTIQVQAAMLLIEWEDSPLTWVLEEASEILPVTNWKSVATTPAFGNGRWQVSLPLPNLVSSYYRLRSQ